MSTFSTNRENRNCNFFQQELQVLQESIVRERTGLVALATKIEGLRAQSVHTASELFEKQRALAFKEHQLNEERRMLNRHEARAHALAQTLEFEQ